MDTLARAGQFKGNLRTHFVCMPDGQMIDCGRDETRTMFVRDCVNLALKFAPCYPLPQGVEQTVRAGIEAERLDNIIVGALKKQASESPPPMGQVRQEQSRIRLADCPVGLFIDEWGNLGFKSQYANNEGRMEAYVVSSGEFFIGAIPHSTLGQRASMVTPVSLDRVAPAVERLRQSMRTIESALADLPDLIQPR